METEGFLLFNVDEREIIDVIPSDNNRELAFVTVQSQGVFLFNV